MEVTGLRNISFFLRYYNYYSKRDVTILPDNIIVNGNILTINTATIEDSGRYYCSCSVCDELAHYTVTILSNSSSCSSTSQMTG